MMFASAPAAVLVLARHTRVVVRQQPIISFFSTATTRQRLPVAIFVDLDNVAPKTHSREVIRDFVEPIREFADSVGTLQRFQAFANRATRTWVTPDEREREFDEVFQEEDGFASTGYDESGVLRCGVCGAKMKLTKKDRASGLDVFDKLDRHMRMLHDREQEKRKTRRRQKKEKLSEKDTAKFRKYESAQVGLHRTPARRIEPEGPVQKPNDLFRLLRECHVKCREVSDVDRAIYDAGRSWMQRSTEGFLVVVSEDADFADLLLEAWSKGFFAVSVGGPTDSGAGHTSRLAGNADLVLTYTDASSGDDKNVVFGAGARTLHSEATSEKGLLLLQQLRGTSVLPEASPPLTKR